MYSNILPISGKGKKKKEKTMAMNKTQAVHILANQGKESSFMANVIQCHSEYKGKAAKYLKALAVLVEAGMEVRLLPFSLSIPCIDGKQVSWESVVVVSTALRDDTITAAQAKAVVMSLDR